MVTKRLTAPFEAKEQKWFFDWVKTQPQLSPYFFHIPNGGYRHKREGSMLKQMGVKAGVSDIFFAYPKGLYHGLWIELKRRPPKFKKPSDAQYLFMANMQKMGYKTAICAGWQEAVEEVNQYLKEAPNEKN